MEQQSSSTNVPKHFVSKNKRYEYIEDFDVGFKNDSFKCYIALDNKNNKKVIIKSYEHDFIKSHDTLFKTELILDKAFKDNDYVLKLLNFYEEKGYVNLVFKYVESQSFSSYISNHDMTEDELQRINKELLEHIFIFNECNFKSFIFISIYSFIITKEGKPIMFDFGLSKLFLPLDEVKSYYSPNLGEIASSDNPTKTNIMNYGITLLKLFYGNIINIKISDNFIDLKKKKKMSKNFSNFISQCLYRKIEKRNTWSILNKHKFVQDLLSGYHSSESTDDIENVLFNNDNLEFIFDELKAKFTTINDYYENFKFNEKTEYIQEIEIFLLLTLFEQLMISKIFNNSEGKFTSQQEISFITISSGDISKCHINFANPIFKKMKIFNDSNNELVKKFLSDLQKYINKIKEITLKVHMITKSTLAKGNYNKFLEEFIVMLEKNDFSTYLFSLYKKANNFLLEKKNKEAIKELNLIKYLCECILFIKESVFESNEEKIIFDKKEIMDQLNKIFENPIFISTTKIKYQLISFLGVLFRFFNNMKDLNEYNLEKIKSNFDGLLAFYPSLMTLIDSTLKKINE